MHVVGMRLDCMRHGGLLNRRNVGHVAAEFLTQRRSVIRKNLGVVRAARDGDISHAAVEQVFRGQLGIDVDQHALCGLPLAGMTRYRITVIEMRVLARVELYVAASVHLQAHLPILADGFHRP